MQFLLLLVFVVFSFASLGATTRTIDADAITSSDHTKTFLTTQLPVAANTAQEIPAGAVNGTNTSYMLAATPGNSASVSVYLDGVLMEQGSGKDYTFSGSTITMLTAPVTGQSLVATYAKY